MSNITGFPIATESFDNFLGGLNSITQPQGGEIIPALSGGVTGAITPEQIVALGGGGASLGQQNLSLRANFASVVAKAPLIKHYLFGSAAAPGPGITTITNLSDLAANFNPFEDFTNLTSINSEIQRYQPFNSVNHVFNPTNLTLQVVNPNNDWQCTNITQCQGFSANVATPIAQLGLADTSTIQLGQMCAVQGGGGVGGSYQVTAFVVNTSVTLGNLNGSPGTQISTGLIFWLPVVGLALSQPYNSGGTALTFATVPPFVTNQMALGVYNSPIANTTLNRSADWRVTSVVGNVVNFAPAMVGLPNLAAGTTIWFLPVVTSGQIWSQMQIDLFNPQTFFAIEADVTLFNSVGTRTAIALNGLLTLAQFNSIPSTTPQGAWPAFWGYSANDGNSNAETGGASELDFMEIQYGCTQDCAYLNSGAVSYSGAATMLGKSDSGWTYQSAFGIFIPPPPQTFAGRNLFQFIFTNGMEYRFFNGILLKVREFMWTNQRPMQFAVDLAAGGLTNPLLANTIFPNNPAGFANMQTAVNGIRIWYQAAAGGV